MCGPAACCSPAAERVTRRPTASNTSARTALALGQQYGRVAVPTAGFGNTASATSRAPGVVAVTMRRAYQMGEVTRLSPSYTTNALLPKALPPP